MSGSNQMQAVIRAVDETSTAMREIRQQLARTSTAAEHANERMRASGVSASLMRVGESVRFVTRQYETLGRVAGGVYGRLSSLVPAIGGLGALTSIGGLFRLVDSVATSRAGMIATAESLGLTTKQLGALSYLAKQGGVDVDSFTTSIGKLQVNMAEAAAGKNKDVVRIFSQMGLALKDAKGHARDVTEVLPKIAESLSKTTDQDLKRWVATTLMGRGGGSALPLFLRGGAEMKRLLDQAINEDPGSTGDEDLKRYHQATLRLQSAVSGIKSEVGAQLAPILEPVLSDLADYLRKNRKEIATSVRETIKDIKSAFLEVDWKGIGDDLRWIFSSIRDVIDGMGGLRRAIELVIALKVGSFFVGLAQSLGRIADAAAGAGRAIRSLSGAAAPAAAAAEGAGVGVAGGAAAGAGVGGLIARGAGFATRWAGPVGAFLYMMAPKPAGESGEADRLTELGLRPSYTPTGAGFSRDVGGGFRSAWGPGNLYPDDSAPMLPRIVIPTRGGIQAPRLSDQGALEELRKQRSDGLGLGLPVDDGQLGGSGFPSILMVNPATALPPPPSFDPRPQRVEVHVYFENAPQGIRVETASGGSAEVSLISVGKNSPMGDGWSH